MSAHSAAKPAVTEFEVDGESRQTTQKRLTPNEILQLAGIDPSSHYLVEIKGRKQKSYKDAPNTPIRVQEHDKFISVATGPTPVS